MQVRRVAPEQGDDAGNRLLHRGGRRLLGGVAVAPHQPRPGGGLARFGQLQAEHAVLAPHDAAGADRGGKQREAEGGGHGRGHRIVRGGRSLGAARVAVTITCELQETLQSRAA